MLEGLVFIIKSQFCVFVT